MIPKKKNRYGLLIKSVFLLAGFGFLLAGFLIVWLGTATFPDFDSFEERKIIRSTKIYDRSGEVALYDITRDIKRTVIHYSDIGANIKNATVAVEDAEFFQHKGIRLKSIIRAVMVNLSRGKILGGQGASTITQQIIKNTLLTSEKTIIRKLKEWILAVKMEQVMNKEEILAIYLNEAPYGGSVYGIYEAAQVFFDKEPRDLTLAEAAYIAAMPKAPTFYSPYGENKDKLEKRKNFILSRMNELAFITPEEYETALEEEIEFESPKPSGIQAPHFVFFIKQYLEERYGKELVGEGGLKIITTLDWELQKKAEEIVLKYSKENEEKWNASNAGMVAIDAKTGQILVMVGSRDYFDDEIQGQFNITTAGRQPGSAFKPFVYTTAFKKGYRPDTMLFDVLTEFQTTCDPYGKALPGYDQDDCYMPRNYDNKYKGPVTLRTALSESRNAPSVRLLYLAGIAQSIKTATEMGITTLTDPNRYGLTLVLGGGEVKLLEMVSGYATFAASGIRYPHTGILRVLDSEGQILEEYQNSPKRVLDKNVALMLTDILSDSEARRGLFSSSAFYFKDRDVALKTGTTDDKRDAWLIGYTTTVAMGVWSGNNDNTPMKRGSAMNGPMWRAFMDVLLKVTPDEKFEKPVIETNLAINPRLRGHWQGGENFFIDTISGKLATPYTPPETLEEKVITGIHSILYFIDKNDPLGSPPDPDNNQDSQLSHWEVPVLEWWEKNKQKYEIVTEADKPQELDDIHTEEARPIISIKEPNSDRVYNSNESIKVVVDNDINSKFPLQKVDVFVNNIYLGSVKNSPFEFSFTPLDIENINTQNEVRVIAYDSVFNRSEATSEFRVSL